MSSTQSESRKRLLLLREYLLRYTDEQHPATLSSIQDFLVHNSLSAERKTLYLDLAALRESGLDLVARRTGSITEYFIGERQFQTAELKLLVDSVQVSRFITDRKCRGLITRLESLCSVYQGQFLNRHVFLANRVRTSNEHIYINVDRIYEAIAQNRKIRFHYFEYDRNRQRQLRRNGAFYVISPFAMTWSSENYYLVAYDAEAGIIKHYRVDKMVDMEILEEPREGEACFAAQDMPHYMERLFNMFTGEEYTVTLRFENNLAGVVLDRMGDRILLVPSGPDHFTITIQVAVSPPFFGWLCSFGDGVKILSPECVAEQMRQHLRSIQQLYQEP